MFDTDLVIDPIDDTFDVYFEPAEVTAAGDLPGHDFHGNQYTDRYEAWSREHEGATYYHGTNEELAPGATLEPPAITGKPVHEGTYSRGDRVYLTKEKHLAERYAVGRAGRQGGTARIYEVRPVGAVQPDAEYLESGFGLDQAEAPLGEVVREVDLPGTVHWDAESGAMKRGPLTAAGNDDYSDSAMIAWRPSPEEARALALEGGENVDHLHLTILYLGKVADLDTGKVGEVTQAVTNRFSPFTAEVAGRAIFQTDDGRVLVALVDAPELEQLQQRLHDEVKPFCEEMPDNHGFTAHITLKYLQDGEPVRAEWFDFTPITVEVIGIETDLGEERTELPLATEVSLGEEAGHPFHGNQWTGGEGGSITEKRVKQVWPKTDVNFDGLHPSLQLPIADRLIKFGKDFPKLAQSGFVQSITVGPDRGYAYTEPVLQSGVEPGTPEAETTPIVGTRVVLGEDFFGTTRDDEWVRMAVDNDKRTGYHNYEPMTGTIDHELGHVMDFYSHMNTSKELIDHFLQDGRREIARNYVQGLGKYGYESPMEAIGEAVAQDRLGTDGLAPGMQDAVDRLYERARGEQLVASAEDWSSLDVPEKTCRGITSTTAEVVTHAEFTLNE